MYCYSKWCAVILSLTPHCKYKTAIYINIASKSIDSSYTSLISLRQLAQLWLFKRTQVCKTMQNGKLFLKNRGNLSLQWRFLNQGALKNQWHRHLSLMEQEDSSFIHEPYILTHNNKWSASDLSIYWMIIILIFVGRNLHVVSQ